MPSAKYDFQAITTTSPLIIQTDDLGVGRVRLAASQWGKLHGIKLTVMRVEDEFGRTKGCKVGRIEK